MADDRKSLLAGLDSTSLLLSQAKSGDTDAARQLLSKAADSIDMGASLPKDLASWVSSGLHGIAQGQDAKDIFLLKKPRGKPSKYSAEFARFVAEDIHDSRAGLHKALNPDGSGEGAYAQAARRFGISENTAEKFYKKYIEFIQLEDQIQKDFKDEHEKD